MPSTTRMVPGLDVVEVADVRESLDRFGDRYLRRVHRDTELAGLDDMSAGRRAGFLAGRFAAKEAVYKCLRIPVDAAVPWTAIEIGQQDGAPSVRLHGAARHWAHLSGVDEVSVSITHGATTAMAMAIAHQTTPVRGDDRPTEH